MVDPINTLLTLAEQRDAKIARGLEEIYSAAQPGAVYSEPVTAGSYTVIMASETVAFGGLGSEFSFGVPPFPLKPQGETTWPQAQSSAGGIGGGGGSGGRPVAIIILGPHGVTAKPVVDVTKIALASVTVCGTLATGLWRMCKARRRVHV